jgi:hypothetical protein
MTAATCFKWEIQMYEYELKKYLLYGIKVQFYENRFCTMLKRIKEWISFGVV